MSSAELHDDYPCDARVSNGLRSTPLHWPARQITTNWVLFFGTCVTKGHKLNRIAPASGKTGSAPSNSCDGMWMAFGVSRTTKEWILNADVPCMIGIYIYMPTLTHQTTPMLAYIWRSHLGKTRGHLQSLGPSSQSCDTATFLQATCDIFSQVDGLDSGFGPC